MSNLVSKVRIGLKQYPILFIPIKFIYNIYIRLIQLPNRIKKVYKDYQKIEKYSKNPQEICWFMCVPSHANMGDQAMAYSGRKWIAENYPSHNIIEISCESIKAFNGYLVKKLRRNIMKDDLIFIQGGYTTGDKSANERAHQLLAKYLCYNKIVFFPQTAFYTSKEKLYETANIYNKHGKIVFLARDKVSFESVKGAFSNINVLLFPDIVSSLIGNNTFPLSQKKNGVLLCIREDSEKYYTSSDIKRLKKQLAEEFIVDHIDLMMQKNNQTPEAYEKIIQSLVHKMSCYKVIITDRFHGILFSILSQTPVVALDSIDYKVREGAKMFSEIYPGAAYFAPSIEEAIDKVRNVYSSNENIVYSSKCDDLYYKKLKKIIDNL